MLSKDVLGLDLFNKRNAFCNKTRDELMATYGNEDAIRLAACKADAEAIINHLTTAGVINVTVATTGTSTAHTGTGTGTIS